MQVGSDRRNLVILAFPTNDFHQERGTDEEIKSKVIEMLGGDEHVYTGTKDEKKKESDDGHPTLVLFQKSSLRDNPVYKLLRKQMPHSVVRHNFFKYVIDGTGRAVSFYTKKDTLLEMVERDETLVSAAA